jgi:sugar lactone lactonase YvrE
MQPRHVLAAALSTALVATGGAAVAAPKEKAKAKAPSHIDLPDGFQPEGIAAGRGHDLFVGSLATGQVLRVDARTGRFEEAVPRRPGHVAAGLKATKKDVLFVSGGPTGKAFVYSGRTGAELASFQLAPDATTFINDVALTHDTAYFTDSSRQAIYAVARDLSGFRTIATPDIPLMTGFNLNGIVATPGGRWLIAVQSATGTLWRIDPGTGAATAIGTGYTNGDGLLLKGRTLYVVQNLDDKIAVVRLGKSYATTTKQREITSTDFDVPTTVARHGKDLFLPNARFTNASPATADYWITRVRR